MAQLGDYDLNTLYTAWEEVISLVARRFSENVNDDDNVVRNFNSLQPIFKTATVLCFYIPSSLVGEGGVGRNEDYYSIRYRKL